MGHEPVSHEELGKALEKVRYTPRVMMRAVKAELVEQEKEHRDIPQDTIAKIVGVESRTFGTWVSWYRAEGVEGFGRAAAGAQAEAVRRVMEKAIKRAAQ